MISSSDTFCVTIIFRVPARDLGDPGGFIVAQAPATNETLGPVNSLPTSRDGRSEAGFPIQLRPCFRLRRPRQSSPPGDFVDVLLPCHWTQRVVSYRVLLTSSTPKECFALPGNQALLLLVV